MKTLETERMTLRLGYEQRPTLEDMKRDHKIYIDEHEDPDVPLEKYEEVVLYDYWRAKHSPYGHWNFDVKGGKKGVGWCGFGPRLCDTDTTSLLYPEARECQAFELEIGWAVSKYHRNKGYASEGAQRLITYSFEELKVRRLIALTPTNNMASLRVMEKIGMHIVEIPNQLGKSIGILERPE